MSARLSSGSSKRIEAWYVKDKRSYTYRIIEWFGSVLILPVTLVFGSIKMMRKKLKIKVLREQSCISISWNHMPGFSESVVPHVKSWHLSEESVEIALPTMVSCLQARKYNHYTLIIIIVH